MSNSRRHRINVYAQTDVGMVRAGNEDTFLVLNLTTSDTWTPVTIDGDPPDSFVLFEQGDRGTILAVSDGMGGALAGEVASRMAVEGVRSHMLFFQESDHYSQFPFHERLRLSVEQANTHINNESMGNADYAGMGATFTAAGIHDGVMTLAQIGDSRCYLIRDGRIALVTHDQSLVWQLVEAGHITEEEAETHQYKNVILQALGAQPRVNVVVDRIELHHGDTVLLCSDGLSGRVKADEMLALIDEGPDLRTACERLIDLANERGGEDNITVIVARFEGEELPEPGDLVSERVERHPDLPYDIEEDVYAETEDTMSPDKSASDDSRPIGSDEAPAGFNANVTTHLAGAAAAKVEAETAFLDSSKVPALEQPENATKGLTRDVADQLARMNDPSKEAIPTMVGMPALTVDEIAADARLREATKVKPKDGSEPAPATPASAKSGPGSRKLAGTIVGAVVCVALVAVAWYVYQQRATSAAERAHSQSMAESIGRRARDARNQLGMLAPSIEGIQPGPQKEEAQKLQETILADLDRVEPIAKHDAADPGHLSEAQSIVDRVDGDIGRLRTLVTSSQ
jgi:serine/threonine protein phosphatase PrpC